MQLIVLGMHRSGTSVLARLLNLMGAYFGPEGSSTGANEENHKGFWERRDVRNLNDSRGRTSTTGTGVFGGLPLFPGGAIGTGVLRPRTFGLSMTAEL